MAEAVPDVADTLSQLPPETVEACAVQLSVPPPTLPMRNSCAEGLPNPEAASKVIAAGSTASCATGAAVTVRSTATTCVEGEAPGAVTVTVPL